MRRSDQKCGSEQRQHASSVGNIPAPKNGLQSESISTPIAEYSDETALDLVVSDFAVRIAFKSLSSAVPTADEARLLLEALGGNFWDSISAE